MVEINIQLTFLAFVLIADCCDFHINFTRTVVMVAKHEFCHF